MFVLGIDPGLSTLGYGLVEGTQPPRAHRAGVIRTDPDNATEDRLLELYQGVEELIGDCRPDQVAIESVFTNRNLRTAISVGRASGVVMLAAAQHAVPVHEYAPTAVKRGVTGNGTADKKAVKEMVARLLGLASPPEQPDAADALAIALCHLRAAPLRVGR